MSQEKVQCHFDMVAAGYDQSITDLRCTSGEVLGAALDAFPGTSEHERVLDLFSGTGSTLTILKEHINPGHMVAVDFSGGMLEQLRAKHGDDPRIGAVQMPVDQYIKLAARDGFDRVTAMSGFSFVPDSTLQTVMQGVGRVLKPGGLFMGTIDPVIEGDPYQGWKQVETPMEGKGTFTVHNRHPHEVLGILAASGLRVEWQKLYKPKPAQSFTSAFWVARKPA